MSKRFVSKHDEPLTSEDLEVCQKAFEAVLTKLNVEKDCEEAQRAAAIVIELYRQGIHDEIQLANLASVARGHDLPRNADDKIISDRPGGWNTLTFRTGNKVAAAAEEFAK
jgi:hypothetical protein